MNENDLPSTASIIVLAELFGVTTRQARNLLDVAKVKSVSRGKWPLAASIRAVLELARNTNKEPDDYVVARARAARAKAEALEQMNAARNRELMPADEVSEVIDYVVGACVEGWNSLPMMITRDLQERKRIEDIVRTIQGQVAKRIGEAGKVIRDGGELPDF